MLAPGLRAGPRATLLRLSASSRPTPHALAAKTRDLASFIRWYIEANGHDHITDWMPRDTQAFMDHCEGAGQAATSRQPRARTCAILPSGATSNRAACSLSGGSLHAASGRVALASARATLILLRNLAAKHNLSFWPAKSLADAAYCQ